MVNTTQDDVGTEIVIVIEAEAEITEAGMVETETGAESGGMTEGVTRTEIKIRRETDRMTKSALRVMIRRCL